VRSAIKKLLLCLLPAAAAFGASQFTTDKPVVNFSLPWFTPEGYRAWMVRGSEARYANEDRIGIRNLTLTIFSGQADEKVDTLILSPNAVVQMISAEDAVVTGTTNIRVISDQFEASGLNWRYARKDKKVSIGKNVRVTFQAEFKDFLK
jgi:hypothetical protein